MGSRTRRPRSWERRSPPPDESAGPGMSPGRKTAPEISKTDQNFVRGDRRSGNRGDPTADEGRREVGRLRPPRRNGAPGRKASSRRDAGTSRPRERTPGAVRESRALPKGRPRERRVDIHRTPCVRKTGARSNGPVLSGRTTTGGEGQRACGGVAAFENSGFRILNRT